MDADEQEFWQIAGSMARLERQDRPVLPVPVDPKDRSYGCGLGAKSWDILGMSLGDLASTSVTFTGFVGL